MKAKLLVIVAVFFSLTLTGCGSGIVPRSSLPAKNQKEIRDFLNQVDFRGARDTTREVYGKDAVPFMIEKVIEIYKKGPDFKYPKLYSIANNLILSLSDIGDNRAIPALKLWLSDQRYRVFRGSAAYALGNLKDTQAIEALRKIWKQERAYLAKGDDRGPWPFKGYHPTGGYVHSVLAQVGTALYKLGEKQILAELIELARISYERWFGGFIKINRALIEITGQQGVTISGDYWDKWWQMNRSRYQ